MKTIRVKDKRIKTLLKKGGRKNARRDFFELLRRAARTEAKELG
jgi:hypothetical protein